ncbi:MAG: hypothetical protein LBB20_03410, partial [Puniceicoccales bacterium]|nr:hypothetical protein [Puniceicoccales bacterium]
MKKGKIAWIICVFIAFSMLADCPEAEAMAKNQKNKTKNRSKTKSKPKNRSKTKRVYSKNKKSSTPENKTSSPEAPNVNASTVSNQDNSSDDVYKLQSEINRLREENTKLSTMVNDAGDSTVNSSDLSNGSATEPYDQSQANSGSSNSTAGKGNEATPPPPPPPPPPPSSTTSSPGDDKDASSKRISNILSDLKNMKSSMSNLKFTVGDSLVNEFNLLAFDIDTMVIMGYQLEDSKLEKLEKRIKSIKEKIEEKKSDDSNKVVVAKVSPKALACEYIIDRLREENLVSSNANAETMQLDKLITTEVDKNNSTLDDAKQSIANRILLFYKGDASNTGIKNTKKLAQVAELFDQKNESGKWNYYIFNWFPEIKKNVIKKFTDLCKKSEKNEYVSFFTNISDFWDILDHQEKSFIINRIAGKTEEIDIDKVFEIKELCNGMFWKDFVMTIFAKEECKNLISLLRISGRSSPREYEMVCDHDVLNILVSENIKSGDLTKGFSELVLYIFENYYEEVKNTNNLVDMIKSTCLVFNFKDTDLFTVKIYNNCAKIFKIVIKMLCELSNGNHEKFTDLVSALKDKFREAAQIAVVEVFVHNFCDLDNKENNKDKVGNFVKKVSAATNSNVGFGPKACNLLKNLALPPEEKKPVPEKKKPSSGKSSTDSGDSSGDSVREKVTLKSVNES